MKIKGQICSIGYDWQNNKSKFKFFNNEAIEAVADGFLNIEIGMVVDAEVEQIDSNIYSIKSAECYRVMGAPGNTYLIKDPKFQYTAKQEVYESKLILEEITVIENKLLRYLRDNPELTRKVNSDLFEKLVCELMNKSGFDAIWTGRNKDTGADVLAYKDIPIVGMKGKYLVECKRYAAARPVGVEIIRSAYGCLMSEGGNGSIIVTTSKFESGAIQFTEGKWNMKLIDFNDLKDWMGKVIK